MDPTIIAGGLKLLGGLFGSKKKSMSPQQSIMSTAAGARQAAKAYGFNPLTLLQASNATAGAGIDMGAPPLASLSILGDIVEDTFGDEAETRREHNRLQNELLRLEVDRAHSLSGVAVAPSAAGGGALGGGAPAYQSGGPVRDFLDEDDRGTAYVDERDATVSYQSHGQETVIPNGPDIDEVLTGVYIDSVNRHKAERARLARAGGWTVGEPLTAPPMALSSGLGGPVYVPDVSALMPPKKKPKYPAPIGPDMPFNTRQKFPWEKAK